MQKLCPVCSVMTKNKTFFMEGPARWGQIQQKLQFQGHMRLLDEMQLKGRSFEDIAEILSLCKVMLDSTMTLEFRDASSNGRGTGPGV